MSKPAGPRAALLLLVVGCGTEGAADLGPSTADAGAPADARGLDDATSEVDGSGAVEAGLAPGDGASSDAGFAFDSSATVTCDTATVAEILRPSCTDPSLHIPVPSEVATVLDLSAFGPGHPDTCGPFFELSLLEGLRLPIDPAAYPMQVILPALDGADPGCEACWPGLDVRAQGLFGEEAVTAFGVALETYHADLGRSLIGGNSPYMLAVSVPPPWYVVSGGGGEAYPWPCISGYQEFGIRSCITLPYGGFGFATVDPNAPSVSAILTLVETAEGLNYADPEYAGAGCIYRAAE